ncbi:hypothetical protein [Klebsiella michiganensis]|uniref:Eaa1 n=1 Tax=Klebsiella michiganensis TaxID=1134687 RepID=A0AB35PZ59_9ENTR|nr:hypothetical protein [Klebsiella michiganensis]MDS7846589.1 hypothetical protein [Klebsiella michiganensis]MDS7901694.1 hypothetical protein [Klebsiella michiganensis]MDS7918891.1 hypothetical protein [Klebsiella michiganensis]MDU6716786.1 hypothetical protein [Klebsiella michiganensis]
MTSKLTREQTQQIIDAADAVITALAGTNDEVHKDDTDKMVCLWDDLNDRYAPPEVVRELARMALAAMDSEPVAIVEPSDYVTAAQLVGEGPARKAVHELYEGALRIGDKLYRHAQPATVVSGEYGDAYQGAREDLAIWKRRALEAEKEVQRLSDINDYLVKQEQGEARMGEPVIRESAPVVPDDGRADFEAWVVEYHKGDTAKAQFPDGEDYANAHTRCVWKAWSASRAAMLQAGNSPVIPEGYVLVPKEPTKEMIAAAMNCDDVEFNSDETFCVNFDNIYTAMIAAAPQEVKGE